MCLQSTFYNILQIKFRKDQIPISRFENLHRPVQENLDFEVQVFLNFLDEAALLILSR